MKGVFIVFAFFVFACSCKKSDDSQASQNSSDTLFLPTGFIPSTLDEMESVPLLSDADTSVVPQLKVTSSPYELFTPPAGDQGINHFGNCTAWAVGYGMLSIEFRKFDGNVDYNGESKVFSPSYIYNQLNGGNNIGIHIVPALNLLVQQGCCKWSYMSGYLQSLTQQPSADAVTNALNYKIKSIHRIPKGDPTNIKFWLARGYPIPFGLSLDSGFIYGWNPTLYPKYAGAYESHSVNGTVVRVWKQKAGGFYGDHAMLICGYDDNIRAFKVLNSWGNRRGDGGFVWIDYDLLSTVVIRNVKNDPELYLAVPDFTPHNLNYNIGDTAFGGIIFYLDNSKKHGLVFDYKISLNSFYAYWDGDPLWVNNAFVFRTTGATDKNIGSGTANTNKIITALATPTPTSIYLGNLCRNNTHGGYSDWFMPSLNELIELYNNRAIMPYSHSIMAWSSTENSTDPNKAWYIDFSTGDVVTDRKGGAGYTIPVRAF